MKVRGQLAPGSRLESRRVTEHDLSGRYEEWVSRINALKRPDAAGESAACPCRDLMRLPRRLHAAGCNVVITGRDSYRGERVLEDLLQLGAGPSWSSVVGRFDRCPGPSTRRWCTHITDRSNRPGSSREHHRGAC